MTNAEIIAMNSAILFEAGKISGKSTMIGEVEVMEYESIHTFAKWKALGYKVKKGEKAIARFSIWKYAQKTVQKQMKKKGSEEVTMEEVTEESCFMKESCFFAFRQVEKIA